MNYFPALHLLGLLVYAAFVALAFWLLYIVVRAAVRRALRDHQEWLDRRETGPAGS